METGSLGIIETWGIIPALEAADAGSKAANVTVSWLRHVRAGLITVMFLGDVSAVPWLSMRWRGGCGRVGKVVSKHVIPRPDRQVRPAAQTASSPDTARAEKEPTLPAPSPELNLCRYDRSEEPIEAPVQADLAAEVRPVVAAVSEKFREGEIEPPAPAEPGVDGRFLCDPPEEPGKKGSKKKSKRKAQLTRAGI